MNADYIEVLQKEIVGYLGMMREPFHFWNYKDLEFKYSRACSLLTDEEKEGLEILDLTDRCSEHHNARVGFIKAVLLADEYSKVVAYKKDDRTGRHAEMLYLVREEIEIYGKDEEFQLSESEKSELDALIHYLYLLAARRKFISIIGVLLFNKNDRDEITEDRKELNKMIENGDLTFKELEVDIGNIDWLYKGLPYFFTIRKWWYLRQYR